MAFILFSRKMLLLLLLVMPRQDSSSFSEQSGRSLILDPGISISLCFSAQSRGRVLPDPGLLLSLFTYEEFSDVFYDLSKNCALSLCLFELFKLICGHIL